MDEHDPASVEAGWEERQDDASGQMYYWNSATGETSWKPPPQVNTGHVIHPWTQVCDENGHVYYLNTETMETQWTPPSTDTEKEEDASLSSDNNVLAVIGGRGRRPSTAEQMTELNRLLSGEDEGKEEEKSPGDEENVHHQETSERSTSEGESEPALDGEKCAWMMFINENDGVPYYYNNITGECLWEPPDEFCRYHQDQPQQDHQKLEQIDEMTRETEKLELPGNLHTADSQDRATDSTLDNEMTDTTAAQVMVTPEFEEKVRQAIAAVSNTPVSSSRLVLVHTPTAQQLAPRSEGGNLPSRCSARPGSGPCSARLRGSPRPSSGAPPATVRVDTVLLPAQDSLVLEEGSRKVSLKMTIEMKQQMSLCLHLAVLKKIMFSWYTGALVSKESDDNANDVDQSPIKAVEGVSMEVEGAASTVAATTDELVDPAALDKNTFMTALKIQCKIRSFLARRRVQAKREELQKKHVIPNENLPASDVIASTTPVVSKAVENEETLYYAQILYPPSNTAPTEEMPISAHREVDAAPSSGPSPTIATQKQHPHAALVSTRLPSVLDVTRYFPQRRSWTSPPLTQSGSTTSVHDQVAITRKKIDLKSPPQARHASQHEAKDHDKVHESRRKEDERLQRTQVVDYQRIYTESRKAFEAEKQRLLDEKKTRDNQRQREAEAERRSRIQTQHERDAARSRTVTPVDRAERLVWAYIKPQGWPNEQNIRHCGDALTETLDPTEFPDKMCAERARELQERIKRLQRASWAVDSQLEAVELRLLSELHPLTNRQRPLQAKYAAKLRCRLEQMISTVQSWQRVVDDWEEKGSASRYWSSIQALYASSSIICSNDMDTCRRQYFLNSWRGAPGGDSLLHIAAWNGREQHVALLVDEGADVNLIDSSTSHRTPLHEACRAGHVSVVVMLLRAGARLNAVDVSGDSPLHVACRQGWTRVVRILLMAANDLGDERDTRAWTQEDYFNLRNGKGRRAIDVVTLPSLMEELQ
ncbi:Ankyrin repeats (3 copies) [Phytophthora infestans]|uniref:Ankyrin repeats (3 copies) n=1 Tax=Phytophthora infestans TaxID=4787 RepID=A0A833TR36_PHYIN|nr:Ankyrin repeats (3 copies) [Phytophthora infestans]